MATQDQTNALVALYVGYFDRAPDPAGLQFWIDQIDNGREFNTIAEDFAASPEAEALYPFLTTPGVSSSGVFFTTIYANLFGRAPDAEGLAFWSAQLADGNVSAADMIEAIINGAQDGTPDKAILDNKVAAGLDFAQQAANEPGFDYENADDAAAAHSVLDGVTEDPSTVDAAQAATGEYFETGSWPGTPGDTFTLTTGVDNLTGTNGNDVFRAVDNNTLQSSDMIDGKDGLQDTLNIAKGAWSDDGSWNATGLEISPLIQNVEIINNANVDDAATRPVLNLSEVSGLEELWTDFSDASTSTTDSVVYKNGSLDTVFGIRGNAGASNNVSFQFSAAELAGDSSTLKLALEDNTSIVTIAGNSRDVENVEIVSSGEAGNIFNLGTNAGNIETITVTGDGDFTLRGTSGSTANVIELVDASAATGDVAWTAAAGTVSTVDTLTVLGGSGNDTFDLSSYTNATDLIINGGDGDDVLTGGAGNDIIDGGAGADTMSATGGNNTYVIEGGLTVGSYDNIEGFVIANDMIDFGGVAGTADNYTEINSVAQSSFNDAREAANSALDGDILYAAVEWEDTAGVLSTYVFADLNGDGAANEVVELTGLNLSGVDFGNIIAA